MSRTKDQVDPLDPQRGPVLSPRFLIAVALIVLGVAWIIYYYTAVRVDPLAGGTPSGPKAMADLGRHNYTIGFGAVLLGLIIAAHRSTPLGRGRGVVGGMLFCFVFGLLWIVTYYVISNDASKVPVFNDLQNYNLVVGIAFMAVGFTYATKWE